MSRYLKVLGVVLLALLVNAKVATAQNVRWDYIATTTSGHGQAVPLLALPGAGVTFYSCSAGVCTTLANTYPSVSSGTPCPTNAQVVLSLSSTCVATADSQGNFGAWFQPGQYAYTLTIQGSPYGPYPFTIGGGSGGSGSVGAGTTGQIAQYPSNGTAVSGSTVSGDATLANGGALTLSTVNSNTGSCGDPTHVCVSTYDAKGRATAATPVAITFPSGGPTLKTNGVNNASQTTLDLNSGSGVTVTNPSAGEIYFSVTGSGVTLQTNGTNNSSQSTLNLQNGTGTTAVNSSGGNVQINSNLVTNNGPIYLFGTSVTEGVGSYVNGNSYADLLATDSANGLQNWGRGGDQAADMVPQVFRKFPKNSLARAPLVLFDPFINDANHCGNTAGCLANGAEALSAAIAWTTIPASYYTYATAATSSGFTNAYTPFSDATLPEIGMTTNTQNATLTFNLTNAGTEVGVTFGACDAYTSATFTVTLGGTLVDTINPIGNDGQTIATQNGATCTLFRKEYANSAGSTVTLVIQKTDAVTTTAGTVSIWAVDTNPTGAGANASVAFVEGTIEQNNNTNAAATAAFDAQANTTATAFKTDGWPVYYVPLRSGQTGANPGVNSTTDMANNPPVNPNENVGLHPNAGPGGGHYHLAQTIENFTIAQGLNFFNVGVSGGHTFFYAPIQGFLHFAPANLLGYNNFSADSTLSQTALNPGGILTNGYVSPFGALTTSGIDFGYDSTISSYIGRSFSSTGYYEICPFTGFPTTQAGFGCGHDIWWSNGDYVKPAGFFRPKGGISYENQGSASGKANSTNGDRAINVNYINTSAGNSFWMLPLCKSNTYDTLMYYYKSTGDTNTVAFNAYNTADSINGNTSTVTGTITAYSITSAVITISTTSPPAVGQAVTLSGFPTSTFLNGVNGTVNGVVAGTSFSMVYSHANASATENGAFAVNAQWVGLAAPYSGAVVQCSIGPTGASTINISQTGSNASGVGSPAYTAANNTFTGTQTFGSATDGMTIAPGYAGSMQGFQGGVNKWQISNNGVATFGGLVVPSIETTFINNSNTLVTGIATLKGGCTMAAGTCTSTFPLSMFSVAPSCQVSLVDGGGSAGATLPQLAISSETASVITVIASDASSTLGVNWSCTGI